MTWTAPDQMTLDELRVALGRVLPGHAVFDGWTATALAAAAGELAVPPDRARLAFPGGAAEMIDAWILSADADMTASIEARRDGMKVRERIRESIWARLRQAAPHREAVRRAVAILAMPQNAVLAARTLWRTADAIWHAAGDGAADFSHYTKRATVGAVYSATLLVWLNDESEGFAETAAFLDRRIEDVMRFEKAKQRWGRTAGRRPSPARFLGRLRYPAT